MSQQKRGLVLLITFQLRMPSFPMPRVGPEVDGDVRMVVSTPSHVKRNHVMCAGMEEHLDTAVPKLLQVAGNENVTRDVLRECLQFLPGVTRGEYRPVDVGAEVSAGETAAPSGL